MLLCGFEMPSLPMPMVHFLHSLSGPFGQFHSGQYWPKDDFHHLWGKRKYIGLFALLNIQAYIKDNVPLCGRNRGGVPLKFS